MLHIVLGARQGDQNLYSNSIPDLAARFASIVEYIHLHGVLPRPPALLSTAEGWSVLDGNHRMAAYLYCYGYFNIPLAADLQLNTQEIQRFWIAGT